MDNKDFTWIGQFAQGGPYSASLKIQVDPASVSRATGRLQPYKSMPDKFRGALEAMADYVRQTMIPKTFENEGPGWRVLSMRTRRERMAQGYNPEHPILIRTRDLFNELTDKSHPKHVERITVGPNSRLVVGGSSTKFIRNQLGNSTLNIPVRPMIPGTQGLRVSSQDQTALLQIFQDKVKEAMVSGRS